MVSGVGGADLHMHTTASDGTSTIQQRLSQADDRNLVAIGITDHDIIDETVTERFDDSGGLLLVTGVEVRAGLFDTKVELLGYFVDPSNERLRNVLMTARNYREQRNRQLAATLTDVTGHSFRYADVAESTDGMPGRPHFARTLVEYGVTNSVSQAFEEYLGPHGDAYVPMDRLPYERVIDAIHDADGLVSLAHPGRIRSEQIPAIVDALADAGLDAIEVWYPYGSDPNITVEHAAALAEEHGLLKTGGSDCHGPESGKFRIGTVQTPVPAFDNLLRAAGLADTVERPK
jgi:predicted metal-dependent phosphoesterase TrpH